MDPPQQQPIAQSSDNRPLSPTRADEIRLTGPTALPDPKFNAYRRDLADRALAHCVIASHYVDAVSLKLSTRAQLRAARSDEAVSLADLPEGSAFRLLETNVGWSWGYGGADNLVGYVRAEALGLD
ncbi:MAG TPA: hypothetical protein VF637_02335 [Sphingomicrobium sp.]